MVDLGQVEESAKNLGPRFNLQKVENPLELNFDELYEAGYSNYDIADAVADEFDKDFQRNVNLHLSDQYSQPHHHKLL